jgi:hypothetical protein
MSQNDDKILELKKQITDKKLKLKGSSKFSPITNCILELDGVNYNLNVLNLTQLKKLAIKVNSYLTSLNNLGFDLVEYSGYGLGDWEKDILSKLSSLSRKEEENNLRALEDKLDILLSNDKRVELELGAIENLLK